MRPTRASLLTRSRKKHLATRDANIRDRYPPNIWHDVSPARFVEYLRIQAWRICFVWTAAGPVDVEITDYHEETDMPARKKNHSDDVRAMTRVSTHPGEMLRAEFLEPLGLSASALARQLDIPGNRITEMIAGRRSLTADTALRLADRFATSPEFWMNLQSLYDLTRAIAARKAA